MGIDRYGDMRCLGLGVEVGGGRVLLSHAAEWMWGQKGVETKGTEGHLLVQTGLGKESKNSLQNPEP